MSSEVSRSMEVSPDGTVAFLSREAWLLDRKDYQGWIDLWHADGFYIVPATLENVEAESSLNYIYDDQDMRRRRVQRLLSGASLTATPPTRTVRSLSRIVVLDHADGLARISSSLVLIASRRAVQRVFAADVEHLLDLTGPTPLIVRKTVRLINADEPLTDISFLL